jgi:SHAQKYF class myb-like DNA-binding protein
MFLLGLQKLGKGDWRGISRNYVVSRTPTQVASHAQKYFIRQQNMTRRKRRSSLFDMVPDEVIPLSLSLSVCVCVCVFFGKSWRRLPGIYSSLGPSASGNVVQGSDLVCHISSKLNPICAGIAIGFLVF